MRLYDNEIKKLDSLITVPGKELAVSGSDWVAVDERGIIMRSDMEYELGGGTLPAVGVTCVTDNEELVNKDEIILCGPDLYEIKKDGPFARIALVEVDEELLGTGDRMYNGIRKIEYVRYHVNAEGYMVRVSSGAGREPVRVSKTAVKQGISFADIGQLYLKEYHKIPWVKAVKLLFVTDASVDYKALVSFGKKQEDITKTIDHALKDVKMDCHTCAQKPICDEVEGMKELHFSGNK